jgi:PAS domain S-box-containing protein
VLGEGEAARTYEISAAPLRDGTGAVVAGIESVRDITAQKRVEAALRESEERFKELADALPEGVFECDAQLRVTYANRAAHAVFGYADGALAGAAVPDLLVPADRERGLADLRGRLGGGRDVHDEYAGRRRDGSVFPMQVLAAAIEREGQAVGLRGLVVDLTERRRIEAELLKTQKLESVGILAGGIAHDFNNILTTIVNSTELAVDDVPEESITRKDLLRVLSAGRRGADLVKQILTFSRPGNVQFGSVDLARVTADALTLVEASLPGNIDVVKSIGTEDFLCRGDAGQLHQIIMNLCTNAFQAMEGQAGRIGIGLRNRDLDRSDIENPDVSGAFTLVPGSYVELTVWDNGPGIAPEILDKIFDPFFTTKSKNIGTGLGLSMVHGIVKGHNGAITITSTPFEDTRFTVLIPRMDRSDLGATPDDDRPCSGDGTILFVEDDPEQRESVPRTLEKLGYRVFTAEDASDALEILNRTPDMFDLVITDYDMPKTSGLDLAKTLKSIAPHLPVILISGRNVEFSRDRKSTRLNSSHRLTSRMPSSA